MKKRIVFGIIAALALLFVLPGCSDPSSAIPLEKIAGPANLKATAYEGMNLLTWNPVFDATGYEVWRKDPVTKLDTLLDRPAAIYGADGETTYHKDYVGFKNKLVDGQNYEYTVVALSSKSTATSNAGIAVQNGVSRASVKAKIPTALTASTFADGDITYEVVASDANNLEDKDTIYVTVSKVQPNYDYIISYTYGANTINRSFVSFGDNEIFKGNNEYVAKFPVLGGSNAVNITASFGGFAGGYYNTATTMTKVIAGTYVPVFDLDDLGTDFDIIRRDEKGVLLRFDDVVGANTYNIYKIETSSVTDSISENMTVTGDWIPVTASKVWNDTADMWDVLDPITADFTGAGNFLYALVIGNSDTKAKANKALYAGNGPADLTAVSGFNVSTYGAQNSNVQIVWNSNPGQTYKLEYAEVKGITPNSNAADGNYALGEGGYKEITITAADNYPLGKAVVKKTDLTVGRNYIFRLTATENGVTSLEADMYYTFLVSGPYNVEAAVTLATPSVTNIDADFANVDLSIEATGDCTIEVYRRTIAPAPQAVFTKVNVTPADASVLANTAKTFRDANVARGSTYEYKVVTSLKTESTIQQVAP